MNVNEQAAKAEQVPVFINSEMIMLDRWTLTTLKAQAYDGGISVEQVLEDAIREALADPERLSRVVA